MPPAKKHDDAGDWGRALREAGPYLGLGTSLAASVLLGAAAGHWADRRLGTSPWLLLLGIALGCAAGMLQFYRTVSRK